MADNFIWYELVTNDQDGAQAFYQAVIGWETSPFGGDAGFDYRILSMHGKGVGGLMALPEGMSRPFWLGYVGVADCDRAVETARSAGATIQRVMDVPTVGKIALLNDPQGVGYALIQGYSTEPSQAFDQTLPGHGNWNELHSPDAAAALAYYGAQHGWEKSMVVPMGPMGDYQLFKADGTDIGGMMNAMPGMEPTWLYYFGTASITASVETITAHGGTILHGPVEVPGGAWVVRALEPQGATFALVGPHG